jgi:hypothetical protein
MLDDLDLKALTRCMNIAMRDPFRRLAEKERAEGWEKAARAAAYHVQCETLGLKPWQEPPCVVDATDPEERDKQAQNMLRRMLDAGVSRFAADPIAALKGKRRGSDG